MSPSGWLEELRSVDIHELGTHNIGSWPPAVKVLVGVLVMILVLALGYSFSTSEVQSQLDLKREEETALKEQFATKAHMAANLERYTQQLKEMENSFGVLLRQLPSDTEVPGLLEDITRTGLGSGLEFEEIKLLPEVTLAVLHRTADPDHRYRYLSRPGHVRQWCGRVAAHRYPA